ncbi:hypothetical protein [Absidia glauca]|uniref:Uncharacterized protein n=1 Tax=Absidia glauca TaxID=4829 RepID=A0A163J013_ABSGL|nr:hypothetical protein [Absidia glauca]SAL98740.1 hypothetical protein [Absidia glauca]
MSGNTSNNEDTTMVDSTLANDPLQMAKTTITTLKNKAAEYLLTITTTIASGEACSNEVMLLCEENANKLDRTKALFHRMYPMEPMFAPTPKEVKVLNIEANQVPGLRS